MKEIDEKIDMSLLKQTEWLDNQAKINDALGTFETSVRSGVQWKRCVYLIIIIIIISCFCSWQLKSLKDDAVANQRQLSQQMHKEQQELTALQQRLQEIQKQQLVLQQQQQQLQAQVQQQQQQQQKQQAQQSQPPQEEKRQTQGNCHY